MSNEKKPLRLLQISDVLLDGRLSFKDMDMPASKRHERNTEALESVLGLCQLAKIKAADALLIVGNLWDAQSVTAATVARLADAFAGMGDTPVIICPGTTDPFNSQSFYNPGVLSAFAIRPWSKNVHIYSTSTQSGFRPRSRQDVCFIGRACVDSTNSADVPARLIDTGKATCLVRLDYTSTDIINANPALNDDYAYTAFGGSVNYTQVAGADGALRGAACGSLIGRTLQEQGTRTVLWVEVTPNPVGLGHQVSLERLPADSRRLIPVAVNINGMRAQNVPDHIRKAVDATGGTNADILDLRITGIYPADSVPDFGEQQLAKSFYHVVLHDATRPDYYLDKMDPRTTEGRFIQFLQDMKVKAESRGGSVPSTEYGAALTSKLIEDALYYGLDALNQRKVSVPDVD